MLWQCINPIVFFHSCSSSVLLSDFNNLMLLPIYHNFHDITHSNTQPFYGLFPRQPGWAGARRELLDFVVQGKVNRGRHTDHPAGRHSIWTNQCPPPPSTPHPYSWHKHHITQSLWWSYLQHLSTMANSNNYAPGILRAWNHLRIQKLLLLPIIMAALHSRCGHYIFALWFISLFTVRRIYASAVLGVVILSVCPFVCHTRALWLIQRTYRRYFYTAWKGNPSSFLSPNCGWWATSPFT